MTNKVMTNLNVEKALLDKEIFKCLVQPGTRTHPPRPRSRGHTPSYQSEPVPTRWAETSEYLCGHTLQRGCGPKATPPSRLSEKTSIRSVSTNSWQKSVLTVLSLTCDLKTTRQGHDGSLLYSTMLRKLYLKQLLTHLAELEEVSRPKGDSRRGSGLKMKEAGKDCYVM